MTSVESEQRGSGPDRRRLPRGGRRACDQEGERPAVLVAESYEGVRTSCSRYLERYHFQVVEASDGEQVVARLAAEPPRVILAELNLPALPAWRLAQSLSRNWRTQHIPVIVLGGDSGPASTQSSQGLIAGVLLKPFSLHEMLAEVRRVLRLAPG
jgi:DNA-binding response OmpR family regulator